MNIYLNGEPHEVQNNFTAAQLVDSLGFAGKRVAMEINGEIVSRSDYATHLLRQDDKIEIVHAIGGGDRY
jgi:sulfur carrier protein